MRAVRFDTKVLGGYWCDAPHCQRSYINMYRDPCWQPRKKYGRPAVWLGLSPSARRRRKG